jgi:drug/metabolite transporter (DMT)-like permease
LVWGATFVVVKGALEDASVFAFLAVRFALAALLMAMIHRRAVRHLTHAEIWAGAQIGFFMFAGYAFQTLGLIRTTPSKAGFITGFGVVLVPVLMALLWGRRVNRWVWGGALAALLGLYYLTVPAGGFAYLNVGDLLVFVCAVLFALHIIYVGRYSRQHSVGALSFLQVATTAVLTLVALPVASVAGWEPLRLRWTTELLFAVLITAGLATALAFSVQVWAQQYTTPAHTAILFSLEPVFAALTSYVMLGERLGGRGLVGAGLILVGILVAELKGPTQAAVDSPGPVAESVESSSSEKPRLV